VGGAVYLGMLLALIHSPLPLSQASGLTLKEPFTCQSSCDEEQMGITVEFLCSTSTSEFPPPFLLTL
jgi:hypothetical protein